MKSASFEPARSKTAQSNVHYSEDKNYVVTSTTYEFAVFILNARHDVVISTAHGKIENP